MNKLVEVPSWPTVLRFSGLWLIWSGWSSAAGWLLSIISQLSYSGYIVSLPLLGLFAWLWWRYTSPCSPRGKITILRLRRGGTNWLKVVFLLVAALSLFGALLHQPWSFDAVTYRLPRCLYWLAEKHWHWIGTIDGRLDYSSCGLEWQMVPILLFTKTDRFLFLLSFVPFFILPGLTYLGGRTLGLARKHLLIWMWLLPCAYCIALQCSGLQNDGYTTSYTLACLAFAGFSIRNRNAVACGFSGLALALLTGAKLSNLPLLLPLGLLFLIASWRSNFWKSPIVVSLSLMVIASFIPLALMSIHYTGSWSGDPNDQWGFRTGNPIAATSANLIIAVNDLAHPPLLFGTGSINQALDRIEDTMSPFYNWLRGSHRMFSGIRFGDLVYEGGTGAGFSIGLFLAGGMILGLISKRSPSRKRMLGWQSLVISSGIVAWLALLSQLGSGQSARNTAPYLPLLLFSISLIPIFRRFLDSKYAPRLALVGMLSVVPVICLTPARPLLPISILQRFNSIAPLAKIENKYIMWRALRDDLQPMRDHLPLSAEIFGYAGAFRDTSYGLWKPLGKRVLWEIGVPVGSPEKHRSIPSYIVATRPGIKQRFGCSLEDWMLREDKEIRYAFERPTSLEGDDGGLPDSWFLLGPKADSTTNSN